MPARSVLLAAVATLALIPATASAGVTVVTISQDGDAFVNQPSAATFTANAFDNGAATPGPTTYYFTTDCTDPSDPAQYAAGPSASKNYNPTFTTPGTHIVCAAVYDGAQSVFVKSGSFKVNEVDPGPTATLTVTPASAVPGQVVTFDASGSVNAVPGALNFTFDVDGDPSNGYEVDNGTNPILTHVYTGNFSQRVGVRVIDRNDKGASASAQLNVTTPVVTMPGAPGGPPILQPSVGDGPIGNVAFTVEKTTIQQFLSSGMVCKLIWGEVFGKAEVKYYLVTSKKVKGKKKLTKLLIAAASDTTFYSPGSGFTREAQGKAAAALRKLKKATIELDWSVTSKKGDKKTGVLTVVIPKGL